MPKFRTSIVVKPLIEDAITPRALAQRKVRRLTQISLAKQATRSFLGDEIVQMHEKTMLSLEEHIPELAACALKHAYYQALASGASVLEAVDGSLVATKQDGSRQFLQALPSPYQIKLGSKRFRRAN